MVDFSTLGISWQRAEAAPTRATPLAFVSIAALALSLATAGRLAADDDFIRGDVNGDGEVSVSDAGELFLYLFEGTLDSLPCYDAADIDDSGKLHILDILGIVRYDVYGRFSDEPGVPPLPAPHSTPGADPTPDDELDCVAWGGGEPLDDVTAQIEIADAYSTGDGKAHILIAASASAPLLAVSGSIRLPAGVVADVKGEAELADHGARFLVGYAGHVDGDITFGALDWLDNGNGAIPAGETVPVVELTVCLAEGTPAGSYALEFVEAEATDAATARPVTVDVVGGELVVTEDVATEADCQEDPNAPPPLNAQFRLSGGVGVPGGEVPVSFFMRADAEIQAYAFSIDFEEEVVSVAGIDEVWARPDGKDIDFAVYEWNNDSIVPGSGGIDEGFAVGVALFGFTEYVAMPANTDVEALRLRFAISPNAAPDTATELRFLDGGKVSGDAVRNAVSAHGQSEYTQDSASSFVLLNASVAILPELIVFIRGDSNGDDDVNIADVNRTLNWLFRGDAAPACLDAADANDDGAVDIADPIRTLDALFRDSGPLPAPFPTAGGDATPDDLTCEGRV